MNGISKLLATDGYIQVNKTLIKELGLHEAVILGELCAEYNYWDTTGKLVDNMFYSTRENIEENTGLNEHYQRKAINTLKEKGFVTVIKKGLPATNYYKIDFYKILMLLGTSPSRDAGLDVESVDLNNNKTNKNKENKLISKDISSEKDTEWFIDKYHEVCVSLPTVRALTDKRKKAIQKILKKYSYDEIVAVFTNAEKSNFLTGKNDRGWKADIDFILREDKFINILEGKYSGKTSHNNLGETNEMGSPRYSDNEIKRMSATNSERRLNGKRTEF